MIITNKFKMDLQRSGVPHVIDAVQGDKNSRSVEISLYSGGVPWNVPDGAIGIVRFKKPDRTGGAYDTLPDGSQAVNVSENVLTAHLAPQVLTASGEVNAQVEMVSGDISLATFSFAINVAEDPSVNTLESEDYVNVSNFISEEIKRLLEEGGLSEVEARLEAIEADIADLKYVPIDITSLSNNVGTVELGSTVQDVTVSWVVNKQPVGQTVNGKEVPVGDRSAVVAGPFASGQTFTVRAVDEREAVDQLSTSISFVNGVYYGMIDPSSDFDSVSHLVLSLTRKLQSARALTFTANAGAAEQIAFALPTRYGTPVFSVGGFEGGFSLVLPEFDFTNASGYTEKYNLWLSDNPGLGSTTVKVS